MLTRHVLFAAAVLATGACAAIQRSPTVASPPAVLMVDNRSTDMLRVYMYPSGGVRTRLGDAEALTITRLRIEGSLLRGAGDVQFVTEPIAGTGASRSQSIYVAPGDTVRLIVQP
jgi:hypothetical protein